MRKTQITSGLRGGTALSALVLAGALFAVPAFAQSTQGTATQTTGTAVTPTPTTTDDDSDAETVVVTGSLFSTTGDATPSPVTVVTAENLEQRGISTVQDAIQQLASNNGPALTNAFTANGAFAAGASAVSLRGLSTNSTLVLFDGLRAAYYPLADDGSRNFVDLNTIPDDIIERIEVLRDGASSTYGADAIAGVVNIITKREYKGVGGRAEAGISERGDAGTKRLTLTAGVGDLDEDGYNAYISGFYYKSDALYNRDRPYPFNSDDARRLCFGDPTVATNCGGQGVVGGLNFAGTYTGGTPTGSSFIFRPFDPTNTTVLSPRYQNLSTAPCPGSVYTLTAADLVANPSAPTSICQADYSNLYAAITPNIERFGVSGRLTAKLGDTTEAYFEANFIQSKVDYTGFPATVYGGAPTGIFYPQFRTSGAGGTGTIYAAGSGILALPIYVCSRAQGQQAVLVNGVATIPGCTAANGTLNPQNPYAAAGQVARIFGRDLNQVTENVTRNRAYRAAFGVNGNFTDSVTFNVSGTAMHEDLIRQQDGYVYIQHLLDVIADGSYNFRNPGLNSQATNDYLTPVNRSVATSDQYQIQASVAADLFELPGGALKLGGGVSVRYEAVDAPSGNSDINGPTQRYFTLNAFGTTGDRTIKSAFAEVDAPIMPWATVNASGRYDHYSSGQSAFSPKVGVKLTPIKQVVVRGTYSRGFRIPSFGESNALPTTGYVNNTSSLFNNAYLAQYGCTVATFSACPTYIRSASYGLTTLASPNLQPEKSRSFTAGILFEPTRGISFTVDYFNIKKTGAITGPDTGTAITNYYAGLPIDPSITIVPNAPDPNFLTATPTVAFAQAQLINADTVRAEGLDFTASAEFDVTDSFSISTSLEASYIINLSTEVNGVVQKYEGTLGNYALTAGSGTQEWKGSWQTRLDFGNFDLTGTVNYVDGYNLSATDQGTDYRDCGLSPYANYCDVPSYVTFDMTGRVKINDQFTFYGTVLNLFDRFPPIDPVTYGALNYNPVQGGNGILGRYFKAGVRVGF